MASLSCLESLFLDLTSDGLNNCYSEIKKAKSSVDYDKDSHQRGTIAYSGPFDWLKEFETRNSSI